MSAGIIHTNKRPNGCYRGSVIDDHPIAAIFPLMSDDIFQTLVRSIQENGFDENHPIILFHGKILDGRNRYRACIKSSVNPVFRDWSGENPWEFVWIQNATRRHLEPGQRAALKIRFLRESGQWEEISKAIKDESEKQRISSISDAAKARRRDFSGKFIAAYKDPKPAIKRKKYQMHVAIANAAGVSPRTVSSALWLEQKDSELFYQVANGTTTIPKARAQIKIKEKERLIEKIKISKQEFPTDGPFDVLVVDPPWRYETRRNDPTHQGSLPYPDMDFDEILSLPISSISSKKSILWLWTTNAFMKQAFQCIEAWGFEEKTILTWVKTKPGTGNWLRGQTEHAILATRGNPTILTTFESTVLYGSNREHSRKPESFYQLVESICPGERKLDVFARTRRNGWVSWGIETEKFKKLALILITRKGKKHENTTSFIYPNRDPIRPRNTPSSSGASASVYILVRELQKKTRELPNETL